MTEEQIVELIKYDLGPTEGFFSEEAARFMISFADRLREHSIIVEIGSYLGRSTIVLGKVAQQNGASVYAIDPHNGELNLHLKVQPTRKMFLANISHAGLDEVVTQIFDYSYNVQWDQPIDLLFIDGLHDYENVARDFHHFEQYVKPEGHTLFHDYYDTGGNGVSDFVNELLADGYHKLDSAETMIAIQRD